MKTKVISRILELDEQDKTVVVWNKDLEIDFDINKKSIQFEKGDKTLVTLTKNDGPSVDMKFDDDSIIVGLHIDMFTIPVMFQSEEDELVHNNVPEWAL